MPKSLNGAWHDVGTRFEARKMTGGSQVKEKVDSDIAVLLDSKQKPAWHVVVLSVFTLGAYNIYWLYSSLDLLAKQGRILKEELGAEPDSENLLLLSRLKNCGTLEAQLSFAVARPILTSLLFALPVVNLIVLLAFAGAAAKLNTNQQVRKHAAFNAFLIALTFGALTLLSKLPSPFFLAYTLSCLPLAVVQTWLNSHWKLVENDSRLARQAFSLSELTLIIVGAIILGLIFVGAELHL